MQTWHTYWPETCTLDCFHRNKSEDFLHCSEQEVSKAHGLTLSQGSTVLCACSGLICNRHGLAAGKDGRIGCNFGFVWSGIIYWILPTMYLSLPNSLNFSFRRWRLMADETASLGLEVNWQKTKIQALGRTEGVPLTVTVKDHEVTVAEEFVYLGSLIHSSVQSTHDINRCSAIAHQPCRV